MGGAYKVLYSNARCLAGKPPEYRLLGHWYDWTWEQIHRESENQTLISGGRNSSVGSAWARCPQRRGFDPPLGTFSVEGIFPWS